jgi:hypothetical protein
MSTNRERTRSIWMDIEVSPRVPMLDELPKTFVVRCYVGVLRGA